MRFTPLWTSRFFTGLYTNRNPLRDAGTTRNEEKYYGARGDGFLAGINVELSQRLTPIRRPGTSIYNSANFGEINSFYEFRLFSTITEDIKVMVDETLALYDGTGPSTRDLVWTKSAGAGQTFMQYIANILYFGNGVDQKKWIQSITPWAVNKTYTADGMRSFFIDSNGDTQQLISTIVPISTVAVTGGSVTCTTSSPTDLTTVLSEGLQMTFNLATAVFLNAETLTITNVTSTTFSADLTTLHATYGPAADTGLATVLEGGNAVTSASSVTFNPTLGGTTTDNTALWVNRGPTIENFGIAAPTQNINVNLGGTTGAWQPNTYYSILGGIIDSNGNFQTITTPGKSGKTPPTTWATTLGDTTIDGTVLWTCTTLAASMVWAANTEFSSGALIVATPTSDNPSVFQLQSFTAAQLSGPVTAYLYNSVGSGVGTFKQVYPASLGSALITATGNSLLINDPTNPNTPPLQWATLDPSGAITGYTTPFTAHPLNFDLIILATLVIPAPGNYTVSINHVDGMFWGVGNGATLVSGPNNNPNGQTVTAGMGYTSFGGRNLSGESQGGTEKDTFIINCPTAGDYPLEIDYNYRNGGNGTMCFYLNGNTPVPGGGSSTRTTGPTTPLWPSFTNQFAPAYAQVSEASGQVVWANIGYVSDFAWRATTNFITPGNSIVDNAGYLEAPFESGATAVQAPTFVTNLNGITPDNPNLNWINQGKATAPAAGTLSAFNGGWSYCIALVNTLTDTVSNAGAVTTATGSFLGASGVTITGGLPPVIDPQVDYVAIFRTEDGGGTYFLIPGTTNENTIYTIPLAVYLAGGYVDTTLDADLDIEVEPALAGENTPPPVGLINLVYHVGRILGSVANVVQWSSGPDTPVGNGYEGFAPLNSATYPSLVKRIVPTVIGAIIFTVSDVYLISGRGTAQDPFLSAPYIAGLGLLNYNALAINGTLIYLFSADSQVVEVNPSGVVGNVGIAIGDLFDVYASWNPATAHVAWHVSGSMDQALYIGDAALGYYRMMTTPAPETGLTWSPFAGIVGGCGTIQSVEISPGVHRLLIAPSVSGQIGFRDPTANTDFGNPYPANAVMGSIVLAQPGQLAEIAFIATDCIAVGSTPTLSVRLNEIAGNFADLGVYVPDPPQLLASTSLYNQRFYFAQPQVPRPPGPITTPTGQRLAWAYPASVDTSLNNGNVNSAWSANVNGGFLQTTGIVFGTPSNPSGFIGAAWSGFAMPTLPSDAVIHSMYGCLTLAGVAPPGEVTAGAGIAAAGQSVNAWQFNPANAVGLTGWDVPNPTSDGNFPAQITSGVMGSTGSPFGLTPETVTTATIGMRLAGQGGAQPQLVTISFVGIAIYFSSVSQPTDPSPAPVLLGSLCRHLQIQFAWPEEDFPNEMLSLTLYGAFSQER